MILFLSGFFVLFFELACIRWFPANVIFLQFFTNIILVASFLGVSLGCLLAGSRTDWLARFPRLVFYTVASAILFFAAYEYWSALAVNVTGGGFQKAVFFGVEGRNIDLAAFTIPLELVASVYYLLVILLFIGPGQVLGRAFNAAPDRLKAYALNVLGSISGVVVFSLLSAGSTPAWIWFLVSLSIVAVFLAVQGCLGRDKVIFLVCTILIVARAGLSPSAPMRVHWSPYYMISHNVETGDISVDAMGHQSMTRRTERGSAYYSLVHRMWRDAGQSPFENALIIGAGSGNDVSRALDYGVPEIDAVEIDPVIYEIGRDHHPDRPYSDGRVRVHIEDGRHFLRSSKQQYDLIVYALVDSLKLASSFSNLRLENFLFTREAFEDLKRRLSPRGIFVSYNFFRQGWVVSRISSMLTDVFGSPPLVLTIPPMSRIDPDGEPWPGFSVIIAGNKEALERAFEQFGQFWVSENPEESVSGSGFAGQPLGRDPLALRPTQLLAPRSPIVHSTDSWPHLYLRDPAVPLRPYMSGTMALMAVSLVLFSCIAGSEARGFSGHMFFLGAAFMLLETKAVVQLGLLFGSTWVVSSAVFFAILVMILCSNIAASLLKRVSLKTCYAGLTASLLLGYLVDWDVFLNGSALWRYGGSATLALLPVFFAGIIFADSFRNSARPHVDYASNIAGCILGAWLEPLSMVLGFSRLGFVALGLYLFSWIFHKEAGR